MLTTKRLCTSTMSELLATMATIPCPQRRLWCSWNVPPSAVHLRVAVISRHNSSASSPAWKHCSHSADISAPAKYRKRPGILGKDIINLPTKPFQPAAEPCRIDVAGIADFSPWTVSCYDEFNADDESNDSADFSGAEGQALIHLKETEFY
jgi:hypothetical protein